MAECDTKYKYESLPDLKKISKPSTISQHGLGHGIDVTSDNPWHSRVDTAREIVDLREVTQKQGGGSYKHYSRKVVSQNDISLKGSTTLGAFDLVSVGAGADYSRSSSRTFQEVGNKIHTRTIEFKEETSLRFQETLQKEIKFDVIRQDRHALLNRCKEFIEKHHYTHYIKAIMLGALEYDVLTLDEYKSVYSVTGKLDAKVKQIGPSIEGGFKKEVGGTRENREYTKIGKWDEQHHVEDERVIDIKIVPIDMLVKNRQLKSALKAAVEEYRNEKLQLGLIGPLLIKCGDPDKPFYWTESKKALKITVTDEKANATHFAIDNKKAGHPTVFAIQKSAKSGPIQRLAYEVSSMNGRNPSDSPPALRENADMFEQTFSLKDPGKRKGNKTNPHDWFSSEDWLYLRCLKRFHLVKHSKLCMKKRSENEDYELTVAPSNREHNPPEGYMLFSVERVPIVKKKVAEEAPTNEKNAPETDERRDTIDLEKALEMDADKD